MKKCIFLQITIHDTQLRHKYMHIHTNKHARIYIYLFLPITNSNKVFTQNSDNCEKFKANAIYKIVHVPHSGLHVSHLNSFENKKY